MWKRAVGWPDKNDGLCGPRSRSRRRREIDASDGVVESDESEEAEREGPIGRVGAVRGGEEGMADGGGSRGMKNRLSGSFFRQYIKYFN